jgi:hypothetical protein
MMSFDDDDTLAFWWGVLTSAALDRDARKFWAAHRSPIDMLLDLARDDPVRAKLVVVSIINQSQDDWVLECVGAGPIEDLFKSRDEAQRTLLSLGADAAKTRIAVNHTWMPEGREAS